uniref:Uncharacterized protein n=1 Tax=Anguilla anguilla TaxID=7936 RepID=A0A0E9XZX5_ANGAN
MCRKFNKILTEVFENKLTYCEYHQTHFVFQRVTRCTSYQSQSHISCIPFPL